MSQHWTIGSAPESDLVVNVPSVSGRHCRLSLLDDAYWLEDLGSTNGTYVNGLKVTQRVRVAPSDAVTLGIATPMPWPSQIHRNTIKSLTIGRDPENDLVVNVATVSGRHARLTWEGKPDEAMIEDLGSSNGTAIQSIDRRVVRSAFTARDVVYLGTHPLLGSHLLACLNPDSAPILDFSSDSMVIGRDPLCHRVIDLPMISSRHACLSRSDQVLWIEDLESVNGTFVNGVRIKGRTMVKPGDILGLGSHCVRLADATPKFAPTSLASLTARADPDGSTFDASFIQTMPAALSPIASNHPNDASPQGFAATFGRLWRQPTLWISLLLLGPTAALLIAATFRGEPKPVASILYWTAFAAVALGVCNSVLATFLAGETRPRTIVSIAATFFSIELLTWIQSLLLWALVSKMAGLESSWFSGFALLALGASVGMAIGILVRSVSPKPAAGFGIALVLLVVLVAAGGVSREAAAAPTRWVFEGILILNADPLLADFAFPAETERMGLRADIFALLFMFIGYSAAGAFLLKASASDLPTTNP